MFDRCFIVLFIDLPAVTSVTELACVKEKPPETKYFSGSSSWLWKIWTRPGFNSEMIGVCPAVIPYSPVTPGTIIKSTTISKGN